MKNTVCRIPKIYTTLQKREKIKNLVKFMYLPGATKLEYCTGTTMIFQYFMLFLLREIGNAGK